MNINRFNYEEYFLMYVDNELSSVDRAAVEEFVQANADLREELNMLLQTVARADKKITFDDKASLMRNSASSNPVNESNYEEYFLLYGDDELSNEEKDWVEQFVYKHPQYQSEFELLQSVRVTPDTSIVFPDKQSLYRHEKDERVIVMRWWKIAAAAVVVLMIGGAGWYYANNKTTPGNNGGLVKTGDGVKEKPATTNPDNTIKSIEEPKDQKNFAVNTPDVNTNEKQPSIKKQQVVNNGSQPEQKSLAVNTDPQKKSSEERNLPATSIVQPKEELIAINTNPTKVNEENTGKVVVDKAVDLTDLTHDALAKNDQPSVPAVYASNVDDSQIEVLNTTVSNKSKMRGFFRKVGRVVGKATNIESSSEEREDKKGIRIASFQIALK